MNISKILIFSLTLLTSGSVMAGDALGLPLGAALGGALGAALGTSLPISVGSVLGIGAVSLAVGAHLIKRKKKTS